MLAPYRGKLQMNPKPIVIEKYGVALKKSKDSKQLIEGLNKSAPKFKKYLEEYLTKIEKEAGA